MAFSFYWHDYETFGSDPRRDRPAQFAGVRTDEDLNEIGDPLVIYCKPHKDRFPSPEACLITGITPQIAQEKGMIEAEFINAIHEQLSAPQTCGAGYNSLRFDDEVTRHTLYRNFLDPYAREWQNRNSRWDIIDLARMCFALRPEGIDWPVNDNNKPSFRLQDLAAANHLEHESAHDALSDVRATISLARLIRQRQPRLYQWLFELRDKRRAAEQMNLTNHKAVLHTSRMYPSEFGCTSMVMPICEEKRNRNSILVYDLRHDPREFFDMPVEDLAKRLFTKSEDLEEDQKRLPVKSVKLNKCPALAPTSTLNRQAMQRIALDEQACERNREILIKNYDFLSRVSEAYSSRDFDSSNDVDCALYDGFISNNDRLLCDQVRSTPAAELGLTAFSFEDDRLPELLFRYRARNWPASLNDKETQQWRTYCHQALSAANGTDWLSLQGYTDTLKRLMEEKRDDKNAINVLRSLQEWCDTISAGITPS